MEFAGFNWDRGNRSKCIKHGVPLVEIEHLFIDGAFCQPDSKHSHTEERLLAFGTTREGRKLLVAFTLRIKSDGTYIRPISARYMHNKEVAHYEKEIASAKK